MLVLIGLDNMAEMKNVQQRNISSVIIHEGFKSSAIRDENDIAIATLNEPVVFSDTIVPVCLPAPGKTYFFYFFCQFFVLLAPINFTKILRFHI